MSNLGQNIAALCLGLVLVVLVIGAVVITLDGWDVPDLLQVIGGAAVGALATLATGNRQP